jgi:hypothetical protein
MLRAPIGMAGEHGKKTVKHDLNIIGAQSLFSIAYWRRGTSVRQYIGAPVPLAPLLLAYRSNTRGQTLLYSRYHVTSFTSYIGGPNKKKLKKEAHQTFRCASPIFIPIAY